jgi:hypothetical protein
MLYYKMDYYLIGGACSLCGADGTNKTTCPFNPDAKNKNPAKHNASMKAANVKPKATKAKAAKAANGTVKAPRVKTEYHNIVVTLTDGNGNTYPEKAYTPAEAKKVVDWYTKRISGDYFTTYISDFNIEYANRKIFVVSFKRRGEIFTEEIIDPDDDGNHPITIDGRKYLVSAKFLNPH